MVFVSIGLTHALYIRIFVFLESSCDLRRIFCPKYDLLASIRWSVISSEKLLSPVTNEPRYKKLILLLNKPTRCSWAVTFISLVYHSTCFGRFLHPSSGVYNCICSPWYECKSDNHRCGYPMCTRTRGCIYIPILMMMGARSARNM